MDIALSGTHIDEDLYNSNGSGFGLPGFTVPNPPNNPFNKPNIVGYPGKIGGLRINNQPNQFQ